MHTKQIQWLGSAMTLACDGNCAKAWGCMARPREHLSDDPDDYALLSDAELGQAPADPGTYEGGHGKPEGPHAMNKWCSRECERSDMRREPANIKLPDFSKRLLNQPWKHEAQPNAGGKARAKAAGRSESP